MYDTDSNAASANGQPAPSELSAGQNSGRLRSRLAGAVTWLTIAGLVVVMMVFRASPEEKPGKAGEDVLGLRLMRFQGRQIVGVQDLLKDKRFYESAAPLRRGDVAHRLRYVALAGELAGPAEALKQLRVLDQDLQTANHQLSPRQTRLRAILGRLYHEYANFRLDAPTVPAADREFLRKNLDWFGELALAPGEVAVDQDLLAAGAGASAALAIDPTQRVDDEARATALLPARQTLIFFMAGVMVFLLLGFVGLVGLIVLLVLALKGVVKGRMATSTGHGPIYGEAVAVFFVLFATLPFVPLPMASLYRSGILAVASVACALAWPVLRGVPWRQVRQDIGLTQGANLFVEIGVGLAGYLMTLPLAVVGLIVTFLLMQLRASLAGDPQPFSSADYPRHPAMDFFVHGDLSDRIAIVVLAVGIAPLVEEIVFRGLLYQHLREATGRLRPFLSFFASAGLVSFIFAVIHPQGLVAVPALMALAFGFTIVREWRGTLLPSMVGHALNNGLITTILFFFLTD